MADGAWVLVGKKAKKRGGAGSTRARQHEHYKQSSAWSMDVIDRDARVSPEKQRATLRRVEHIAEAMRCDTMLLDTLRAIVQHFAWNLASLSPSPTLVIVSYGLGSFCSSTNAVYQLAFVTALARALREEFASLALTLEVFDPVMNASDREIALHCGHSTIEKNECGQRAAESATVFFMPHCGQVMYRNVLVSNWGSRLRNAVIIGNSFEAYGDRLIDAGARQTSVLLGVLPFVVETAMSLGVSPSHDDYSLYESAFNDLSIHTFPVALVSQALADAALGLLIARATVDMKGDGKTDGSGETIARDRETITTSSE